MKLSGSILVLILTLNPSGALAGGSDRDVFRPRATNRPDVSSPKRAARFENRVLPSETVPTTVHRDRVVRAASAEGRSFGFVEKYQRTLASSGEVYIGRTPTIGRDGTARLNRFIFRRDKPPASPTPANAVRAGEDTSARR
jgi:hypothetical protein